MSLAVMGMKHSCQILFNMLRTTAAQHAGSTLHELPAVFITANISGGHLNPAVTLATMFTGHIKIVRGLTYIFMQICGACFGILMVVRHDGPELVHLVMI